VANGQLSKGIYMRRVVIGIFCLIVLAILFVVLCTFVRKPYETIILVRFGRILVYNDQTMQSHPPMMYHWYLKYPTDRVVPIDNRIHLYTSPLQQALTKGSEPISVRTFAAWRITDPEKFYSTTGSDERARTIIGLKISGLVQARVAEHKLDEIFNTDPSKVHTQEMEKQIAQDVTNGTEDPGIPEGKMSGVADQGLEIVQVGFSRMAFPPDNAAKVYERMAAERNKQAQDFFSQGQALQQQLSGQGEAEAKKIRGEAVEEAQKIMGQGDKEANAILLSVQESKERRDFYQYWKSLEFVTGSFTKNTYIVITTDTPWLESLFRAPLNGPMGAAMTQPARIPTPSAIPSAADFPVTPRSR
jgi:modulator of FtsH protease HflC